jgi:hypothetical protein
VASPGDGGRIVQPSELSPPWRWLITCVLVFLLGGYFAALVNVVGQNELTDGQPGLGPRDLLLKYHGGWVELKAGEAAPSRMLEMIQTAMRQYFDSDDDFNVLLGWLKSGAGEEQFAAGPEPTPLDVVLTTCLRCHAAEGAEEIGTKSPLGMDQYTPDFEMISEFTLAGGHQHEDEHGEAENRVWREPRDWRDLALTTHVHMLSVPMFVVLLGALFLWTGALSARPRLRTTLACAPLVLFLLDIAFWWLARLPGVGPAFALGIGATGALFGASFVAQWAIIIRNLWFADSGRRHDRSLSKGART